MVNFLFFSEKNLVLKKVVCEDGYYMDFRLQISVVFGVVCVYVNVGRRRYLCGAVSGRQLFCLLLATGLPFSTNSQLLRVNTKNSKKLVFLFCTVIYLS